MSNLNKAVKVLDAITGESAEFKSLNNLLTYKLVFTADSTANVKAFVKEQSPNSGIFYLKISSSDWGSGSISLKSKTDHVDDTFTDTGETFTEDKLKFFSYN